MAKTFKFKLYPSKSQKTKLNQHLEICRVVYNKTLEVRKLTYENEGKSLSLYDTNKMLKDWKQEITGLDSVYAQVLQQVQERVHLGMVSFFTRCKLGDKPGYPRFKSKDRYDSFTYKQNGFNLEENKLQLSKIGKIKIKKHREIQGKIKRLTIQKTSTNEWFANFICETEPNIQLKLENEIGIDLGLKTFAVLSDETTIENPRFYQKEIEELAKVQQKFSKDKNNKNKLVVFKVHKRIKNKRDNFLHQESHKLITNYQIIVMEDLDVKNMRQNNYKSINRGIQDTGWRIFINMMSYKAEEAGRNFILVNAKNTTQMCSNCESIVFKELGERIHSCPHCGLIMDRDLNAAKNILRLGIQSLKLLH